jgi:hypothetical protein
MAIYSLSQRTATGTSAVAMAELRTSSSKRVKVLEIHVVMAAATASVFGIGRPAAIGITPTTPINLISEEPSDPTATSTTALAWATPPTVPANFFRRINLPATIGAGQILTFPRGLIIPISSSIVLWNTASNGVVDLTFVVDE